MTLENEQDRQPAKELPLTWHAVVPMVGNRFFMSDMAVLWGLPCLFLALAMVVISVLSGSPAILRFAVIVPLAAFFGFYFLSMVVALILYRNKYMQKSVLTDKGITTELAGWSSRVSKAIAGANLALGPLQTAPAATGAGFLGRSTRSAFIAWKDVSKIVCYPKLNVITVRNAWRTVLRLHCHDSDSFARVKVSLTGHAPGAETILK